MNLSRCKCKTHCKESKGSSSRPDPTKPSNEEVLTEGVELKPTDSRNVGTVEKILSED